MDSFVAMRAQAAAKALNSSSNVKGARKGGITQHISGPHLIPNVGREAMLPGEVVCRRKLPPTTKKHSDHSKEKRASTGGSRHHRSVSPSAGSIDRQGRSPTRSRSQSLEPPSRSPRRASEGRLTSVSVSRQGKEESAQAAPPEPIEPQIQKPEIQKEDPDVAKKRQQRERQAFVDAEKRRSEDEKQKLKELEEAKRRAKDLNESRKKKLGGAFALGADDEDDVSDRQRLARELAQASRRGSSRPLLTDSQGTGTASSGSALPEGAKAAATDIDGRLHDHKYSRVWKDWDSNKRADPGEVARQFMKIAAIKRRGVDAPRRARSRSRS